MLHLPMASAVPEGLQLKKGQGQGIRASPSHKPFTMHLGRLMRKLFLLCACMLLIQSSAAAAYDQSAIGAKGGDDDGK